MENVTFGKYYGRNGNYDLITINQENFDSQIEKTLLNYLESKTTNCEYCFNIENTRCTNAKCFLNTLLNFANHNNKKAPRIIVKADSPIERLLKISQWDSIFPISQNLDEL